MNPGPKEDSHEECRAALMAIPDLIFQIKEDGTFLNYKGAKEDLYVPPEQFIGKKVQEVLPEQLARQTLEYMRMALESKALQFYEYDLQIGDHLKYFETRMIAYEEDKVIAVIRDITDRKRAEEDLLKITDRLDAILKADPDIIMEVDKNKIYTWANTAGYEFFGNEVIGKEAAYYFEGEQKTYQVVAPLFKGSEDVIYVESWQRRKDGEKRLLAWWCRMQKDAAGNVKGALSTARDITEQKKMELDLREKINELKLINEVAIGRELKLIELEKEVDNLLSEIGRPVKYGK